MKITKNEAAGSIGLSLSFEGSTEEFSAVKQHFVTLEPELDKSQTTTLVGSGLVLLPVVDGYLIELQDLLAVVSLISQEGKKIEAIKALRITACKQGVSDRLSLRLAKEYVEGLHGRICHWINSLK